LPKNGTATGTKCEEFYAGLIFLGLVYFYPVYPVLLGLCPEAQ
jgi:hypothetical protein